MGLIFRNRPTDRQLRRWLSTGRPKKVAALVEVDPEVEERLEDLTELDDAELDALTASVEPPEDFVASVSSALQERASDTGAVGLLVDLMGLGIHTTRALFPPDDSD